MQQNLNIQKVSAYYHINKKANIGISQILSLLFFYMEFLEGIHVISS